MSAISNYIMALEQKVQYQIISWHWNKECNIKLINGTASAISNYIMAAGTASAISNYIMALEQRVQYQIIPRQIEQ